MASASGTSNNNPFGLPPTGDDKTDLQQIYSSEDAKIADEIRSEHKDLKEQLGAAQHQLMLARTTHEQIVAADKAAARILALIRMPGVTLHVDIMRSAEDARARMQNVVVSAENLSDWAKMKVAEWEEKVEEHKEDIETMYAGTPLASILDDPTNE